MMTDESADSNCHPFKDMCMSKEEIDLTKDAETAEQSPKLGWPHELVRKTKIFLDHGHRWRVLGLAVAILLAGVLYRFTFPDGEDVKDGPVPLVVSGGEAGKAGDVVVTESAMDLAQINLSPAKVRQVEERLEVTGRIETGGNQFAKVTPRAAGKVIQILAFEGDDVKEGQVLALLESAELARAQAAYRQAKSRFGVFQNDLARQQQLAKLGKFGSAEIESSRRRSVEAASGVEHARLSVSEQKRMVAKSQSDLKVLENLVVQAEADLDAKRARRNRAEALPRVLSLQQLEQLRADFRIAEAEVATAKANLQQGQANIVASKKGLEVAKNLQPLAVRRMQISQSALKREEEIFSRGYSKSRELIAAESALEMAQVELEGTKEAVKLLGGRPGEGSGLALLAPIAGKIQKTSLTLGESVNVEHVAFTLMNLEQVWAELAMAPKDLAKAKVGDLVKLKADSAPGQEFVGHISSISAAADDTTRTVSARMNVENPNAALKVGTFVTAAIITDTRLERLTVPEGALQEHTGRATIYVADPEHNGTFEVRHVILGETGEGWREISDGLKPNEIVATQGTFYLKSEAMKKSLSDGCCAVGE